MDLSRLREEIDEIDQNLLRLLSQRALLAQQVAEIKSQSIEAPIFFYKPEREALVLRKIAAANTGPLSAPSVCHLFREIMSACLALEKQIYVAFPDCESATIEKALIKQFGSFAVGQPFSDLSHLDALCKEKRCDYLMLPWPNRLAYAGLEHAEFLFNDDWRVCGKMSRNSQGESSVDRSSQMNKATDSQLEMSHHESEYSGFMVLGHQSVEATGLDSTVFMLKFTYEQHTEEQIQTLIYQILAHIAQRDISILSDSRLGQYDQTQYWLFEVQGHENSPDVHAIWTYIKTKLVEAKCLGSYPQPVFSMQ